MVWTIFKNGQTAGQEGPNNRDIIDLKLCFFRGPNRLVWYCYQAYDGLFNINSETTFWKFEVKENEVSYLQLNMVLVSAVYNQEFGCMEATFIPDLHNYLNDFNIRNIPAFTVYEYISGLIPLTYDIAVSEDLKDMHLFNFSSVRGRVIDVICKLAREIGDVEVYADGNALSFGKPVYEAVTVPYDLPEENLFAEMVIMGNRFVSFTTSDAPVAPGTNISIRNSLRRVVYLHYRFGIDPRYGRDDKAGRKTNSATSNIIAVNNKFTVTETQLLYLLPEEDRNYLMGQMLSDFSSDVSVGHIDRGGDITIDFDAQLHTVNTNIITHNLNRAIITEPIIASTLQTTPFCGLTNDKQMVGILYPKVDSQFEVIIGKDGFRDCGMSVANLWNTNGNYPLKVNGDSDYRSYFPGGYTEHLSPIINEEYDSENKEDRYYPYTNYVMASKGNMNIGIWSDPYFDKLPEVDVGGLSISMDEDSMELSAVKLWAKEKEGDSYANEMSISLCIAAYDDSLEKNTINIINKKGDIVISTVGDDGNSSGDATIDAANINLNNGTNGAVRVDDDTKSDSSSDPAFWTFWNNFFTAFTTWVPIPSDGGASLKAMLTPILTTKPTKMEGKITSGSGSVKIGD